MGALVDGLLAAIGMKPSNHVTMDTSRSAINPPTTPNQTAETSVQILRASESETEKLKPAVSEQNVEEVNASPFSVVKSYLKETFPRTAATPQPLSTGAGKEDCFSCKAIGVTTMAGFGMYMLYTLTIQVPGKVKRNAFGYRLAGFTMSMPFFIAAYCRLFDLGMFSKEGRNLTVLEHVIAEKNAAYKLLGVEKAPVLFFEKDVLKTREQVEMEFSEE